MSPTKRVVCIVVFDRVDLLDVTGPPEVLALARREAPTVANYDVRLVAESLDPITTSAGVRIIPDTTFDEIVGTSIDTLIVPGSVKPDETHELTPVVDEFLVSCIRALTPTCRRVASVCVGAHLLAATGMLDGKRVTTHWSTASLLASQHPEITVDADPIFIRDGSVWTAAGISSCLDLTLALLADDVGPDIALRVARHLVMYLKRPGGQSQFSVPLRHMASTPRAEFLRHYVLSHLKGDLSVRQLAQAANVGERQLARIFRSELGSTPRDFVENLRVETARQLLESSEDTLARITTTCGFGSVDSLHRAFRRALDITPAQYRQRFRPTNETTPAL